MSRGEVSSRPVCGAKCARFWRFCLGTRCQRRYEGNISSIPYFTKTLNVPVQQPTPFPRYSIACLHKLPNAVRAYSDDMTLGDTTTHSRLWLRLEEREESISRESKKKAADKSDCRGGSTWSYNTPNCCCRCRLRQKSNYFRRNVIRARQNKTKKNGAKQRLIAIDTQARQHCEPL